MRRFPHGRGVVLDRSFETLPVFRLSDSAEDASITFTPEDGGRWRVLPAPGDRLPGTFDQDVYVELFHRYTEAGFPSDGAAFGGVAHHRMQCDPAVYAHLRAMLAP